MTDTDHPIVCGYCGGANPAAADICRRCGASLAAYQSLAAAPSGALEPTPGSAPVEIAAPPGIPVRDTTPSTAPVPSPAGPASAPRDARPTSRLRHISYAGLDPAVSPASPSEAPAAPAQVAPASPQAQPRQDQPQVATPSTSTPSGTLTAPTIAPPPPAPPPAGTGTPAARVTSAGPATSSAVPRPAPRPVERAGPRGAGPDRREQPPLVKPARPALDRRRPDRLARTSAATLMTWGVGLVLVAFVISIALPRASHQTLGELLVTLATVIGIVLFIVGLAHRTGARRPADRHPRRRR